MFTHKLMKNKISIDRWFFGLNFKPNARLRIFAFPYAGGDINAFYGWQAWLPHDIELVSVQLPGRGKRREDVMPECMDVLVDGLLKAINEINDKPFVFFGYSMGGLISYAATQSMNEHGMQGPQLFCVAACNPPHLQKSDWCSMSDKALLRQLTNADKYFANMMPENCVSNNLPLIKNDLAFCQRYVKNNRFSNGALVCPISTFCGVDDTISSADSMVKWRRYTSASSISHRLNGGHFFMFDRHSAHFPRLLLRDLQGIHKDLGMVC